MPPRPPNTVQGPADPIETKLDTIIEHLERLDKRDRMRTWGGFVRSMLGLIPLILVIWSAWYFYAHGTEFMKMIADQAAQSAARATTGENGMLDELMKKYGGK